MYRKFCGVLICLALLAASVFSVSDVKAASSDGIVRIKLSMGDITSTPVFIDGNYSIAENDTVILPRQLYTIKIEGSKLSLYSSNTLIYSTDPDNLDKDGITLIQHEGTAGYNNLVTLNNAEHGYCNYKGDLYFSIYNGYIRVVNYIYIDDYLCGVVPYEMSNSWPVEALKAQAIAARNYAAMYLNSGGDYDMVDTAANQTYHGYEASYTTAIAAVNGTAKQVMLSDGALFEAYYSASNGGVTEIPQHVWSYDKPLKSYHVIKADPYDVANPDSKEETLVFPKVFSDTASVTYVSDTYSYIGQDTMNSLAANALNYMKISSLPSVAAAGYIAGVTGDIEIVGVNSITPHTFEGNHGGVTDSGGTVLYNGNDVNGTNGCLMFEKATVNMTVLAKKYSEQPGYVKLGDVNGDDQINITDYSKIRLYILSLLDLTQQQKLAADVNGDGKVDMGDYTKLRLHLLDLLPIVQEDPGPGSLVTEQVTVQFDIDLHELDNQDGQYTSFYSSSLRLFVVEQTDTSWNIYQRRFGHGIGMSQRGAQQMALEGKTYAEILSFYYPGTSSSDLLSITAPVPTPLATAPSLGATNATVTGCTTLNVRSTPDTSLAAIGKLPAGARIEATFYSSSWYSINYGGTTAYVSASYVTMGP